MSDDGAEFPMPFSGITRVTWVLTHDEIRSTVAYLTAGCDERHMHNFAVQMDGRRIYTTDRGIECVQKHLQRHTIPNVGITTVVREGETKRRGLWPGEMSMLAQYNSERARGVAHTPEWEGAMAALQARFDKSGTAGDE